MKKICMLHKVKAPDGRSFYKEARSLAAAGYDVTLLGLFSGDSEASGVKLIGLPHAQGRLLRFVVTNARAFTRALQERADVYHIHDLDFVPWAVLLKLLTRKKVIYDIHEAYPEYMMLKSYIPRGLKSLTAALVYLLEHGAAKVFDAIIPNDNFIGAGFSHKKKVTIFNFPTLDFFPAGAEVAWDEREFDLFYHGSLPPYTFGTMLSIAEALKAKGVRTRWGIALNDKADPAWAQAAAEHRGLGENFVFLPSAGYLQVSQYLRRARIGIIPLPAFKKFLKNIPLKMFEFMGCGMPVVLSDLPPSRQFIRDTGSAVAVQPDDIDEYAEAVSSLLKDSSAAGSMGKRGKQLVYEKYNWSREEGKLMELYRSLLEPQESAQAVAQSSGTGRSAERTAGPAVIINADDYGITAGVNRAIDKLARAGIVTSTSVMTNMPHWEEISGLRGLIGAGIHYNLTVGCPVLPAAEVPSLVDSSGAFPGLAGLLDRMGRRQLSEEEVERELLAQTARLSDLGILPDHADSHESLIKYPFFGAIIKRVSLRHGIPAVRTYTPRRFDYRRLLNPRRIAISAYLELDKLRWKHSGFLVADRYDSLIRTGLTYSSALQALRNIFGQLPEKVLEIGVHPGYLDKGAGAGNDPLGGYLQEREAEAEALGSSELRDWISSAGARLISFGDLQGMR